MLLNFDLDGRDLLTVWLIGHPLLERRRDRSSPRPLVAATAHLVSKIKIVIESESRIPSRQGVNMSDYAKDIEKYSKPVNEKAVAAIVKSLGIVLRNADASLVAVSDPEELARVRDGFCAKKLGMDAAAANAAIKAVAAKMKGDSTKHRVTFYYLLAEHAQKLDQFV